MNDATLILKNATVITMDPRRPTARSVAITGDRISWVGDADIARGSQTRVIDCRGRTVMPGFIDAHCHVFSFIRRVLSIDLGPDSVDSIAEIKELVHRKAVITPPGSWIIGSGYNEFYLAEKRHPNRVDLDEAAPNNPVLLSHRSLHAGVLNSPGLLLAGINMETPEPPGALIERDLETGEPTGLLYEMLDYIREKVLPPLSESEINEGITRANRHYLSMGITSLQEATFTNNISRWRQYQKFKADRLILCRLLIMAGTESWPEFKTNGLTTGSGDEDLRLGPVKIVLNEATGKLYPSQSELNDLVLKIQNSGFQVAIHAVTPAMVTAAIKAVEYADDQAKGKKVRHRIEHCSECPLELIGRLKKLGVFIVSQPPFLYYSGERYLAEISPDSLSQLYPFGSWLKYGLTVAGSSDHPVVPDNPLIGVFAAITRQSRSGQFVNMVEGLTPYQAFQLYTSGAAMASGEGNLKGSISPGKLADMVILNDNPLKISPKKIRDIMVEKTIVAGEVAWEKESPA